MSQTQTLTLTDSTPDTAIHTRAVLVWLQIGTWSARKYDKAATAKLTAHYQAASDVARVNKALVPADAPAYKAITQAATAFRAAHYGKTLAWADEGWRLLPTAQYLDYTQWYRDAQAQWRRLKLELEAEYPQLAADAPARLNGLYRAADYPSTSDVLSRFTLDVQFSPVPAAGDIRVDLGADQLATIAASITDRVEAATKIAMRDAWGRLHECVAHIAERLSDPKAIFRDSLIANAVEVCDALRRLNVTGDPQLEAMRARVEAELTAYTPDTLRDAPIARQQTAQKAEAIMAAMAGFYGPQGVR
jgi:hypothetical protein